MLHIMKKIWIVLLSLTVVGCNTIRTRTLVNYHDTGTNPTPIESYKVEETRYTTRRNKLTFPLYRREEEDWGNKNDGGPIESIGRLIFYEFFASLGIALPIDLFVTIFIAPFTTKAEHSFLYEAVLTLKGKLVDINNKPLSNYRFRVRFSNQTSTLQTNEDGIFTGTLSVSEAKQKQIPVVFSFPDSKVASITYQTPFKSGTRQIVSSMGGYTSSIPAQGKVLVLDLDKPKAQPKQTKKTIKRRK